MLPVAVAQEIPANAPNGVLADAIPDAIRVAIPAVLAAEAAAQLR